MAVQDPAESGAVTLDETAHEHGTRTVYRPNSTRAAQVSLPPDYVEQLGMEEFRPHLHPGGVPLMIEEPVIVLRLPEAGDP